MRDYSKVSSSFWTGKTGKALRGNQQAQIVALYLMTCPHANMIGVFHCPIIYIAHETGSSIEGALKGLQDLCEGAFCTYDDESETVWVHEMARFQIGEKLSPNDKQVIGIKKQFDHLPDGQIKQGFHERYADDFSLPTLTKKDKFKPSPLEAPSMPEAEAGAVSEKDKTIVRTSSARFPEFWSTWPKGARKVGKQPCEKKWKLLKLDSIADQIIAHVAEMKNTKQWIDGFEPAPLTYLNQGRWGDEIFNGNGSSPANTKPWYISGTGIELKARELGIEMFKGEVFPDFKIRVYKAAGITHEMVREAAQDFK